MFVKRGSSTSIAGVVASNTGISPMEFTLSVREPYVKNLDEAVAFAKDYMEKHPGCNITIIGDYDVDGICATANLFWGFKKAGANPVLRLPHRFSEGYGLSEKIIDEIPSGLLITVDNGIAAIEAIKKAKAKGLAVLVIDHHLPPVDDEGNMILPDADVILDPHIDNDSKFSDYCGAALAYRFVQTMFGARFDPLLALAAIATVADVMPLVGANRTLVRDGLACINRRRVVPGLGILLDQLNMDDHITEVDFGFKIGPIFNAPGRLFDAGAEQVLSLLCARRDDETAPMKANALIEINKTRRQLESTNMDNIKRTRSTDDRPIVLYDPTIGEGVVGIIAGKLSEEYYCPAIVFTDSKEDGIIKGSGRSIPGINLKAALDSIQDLIEKYGGHAGAAGISIRKDNLEAFVAAFKAAVGEIPEPPEDIFYDLDLDISQLGSVCHELNTFAPYGEGNPKIVFHATFAVDPANYRRMGKDNSHFSIRCPGIKLVGFGLADKYEAAGFPRSIECVGYLSESWYKGYMSYQFEIIDFIPA